MTRTTRYRRCIEEGCTKLAAQDTNTGLCPKHDYEAGLENEHFDGHHEDDLHPDCLHCNDIEDLAADNQGRVREEPTRRNMSHANCKHPRTPKGRAACRRLNKAVDSIQDAVDSKPPLDI